MRTGRPPVDEETRFFRFVREEGTCWSWLGTKNRGYGSFRRTGGNRVYAHRWSYELFVGEIPNGLQLDHLCRNRACVNPEHLEPVTLTVNVLRAPTVSGINAAKSHCIHGHEFTPENTIRVSKGRQCRTCARAACERYHQRNRKGAAA